MAFIRVHNLKKSENGFYEKGSATLSKSVYCRGQKYHSKQVQIENLGRVIYLAEDRKSGIFNSPSRGIVAYDTKTNTFEELSKNDPRLEGYSGKIAAKRHVVFGDTYAILEFLKNSGLMSVLRKTVPDNRQLEKLLVHLSHKISSGDVHDTCDAFFNRSFISYIAESWTASTFRTDTEFFKLMGMDDVKVAFFTAFTEYLKQKNPDFGKATYVDSTPLPNDISDNPFNALASHGLSGSEVQMRLALVLDQETGLPVWYEIIPGNLLDMSTLKAIREDVRKTLGIEISDMVLDAGYVNRELVREFTVLSEGTMIARMPARKGYPFRETYDEVKWQIDQGTHLFSLNGRVYFGVERSDRVVGEEEYLYVYIDMQRADAELQKYMEKHADDFRNLSDKEKKFRRDKGGFFILVCNKIYTPEELLSKYFGRTHIETIFKTSKEYLNLLPLKKWTDQTVRGKILADIIGTIIVLEMRKKKQDDPVAITQIMNHAKSITCCRDNNGEVTIETPNRQARENLKKLDLVVPGYLTISDYRDSIFGTF